MRSKALHHPCTPNTGLKKGQVAQVWACADRSIIVEVIVRMSFSLNCSPQSVSRCWGTFYRQSVLLNNRSLLSALRLKR